jgi:hypothetical protein
MSGSYYRRQNGVAGDGSPTFSSMADATNEDRARHQLEIAWKCDLKRFGKLAPIDWFAGRHGRMVGLVELKTRDHAVGSYPTVFLNVRKWLALLLGHIGTGVPALYVVQWTDALRWINVMDIDARKIMIGGTMQIVKATSDIEPVILVPVADMRDVIR